MAAIAIQEADQGNQNITFAAANAGGDTVAGGARAGGWDLPVILIARNTDAATKTVTVDGVGYVIPATTGVGVIPIRGALGAAKAVTYSGVTGVTVAAVRLTKSD
jgi:hypothetical protein